MRVVLLQHQQHLLAGSGTNVTGVDGGDTGIGFGGGGDGTESGGGPARARSFDIWEDEE